MNIVPKGWGCELVLCHDALYAAKLLFVVPGRGCSLHAHRQKDETFIALRGKALLEIGGEKVTLVPGVVLPIPPGAFHAFTAVGDPALILEVSTHESRHDSIRIRDGASQVQATTGKRLWGEAIRMGEDIPRFLSALLSDDLREIVDVERRTGHPLSCHDDRKTE